MGLLHMEDLLQVKDLLQVCLDRRHSSDLKKIESPQQGPPSFYRPSIVRRLSTGLWKTFFGSSKDRRISTGLLQKEEGGLLLTKDLLQALYMKDPLQVFYRWNTPSKGISRSTGLLQVDDFQRVFGIYFSGYLKMEDLLAVLWRPYGVILQI